MAAVLGCALFLSACGSDSQNLSIANSPQVQTGPTDGFFLGRVYLEDLNIQATATIKDLNGNTLYTLPVRPSGVFYTQGKLPADFRIEVRRDGDSTVYVREVRGGYDGWTMYVNPLSTLVARYMDKTGASLPDAQQKVSEYFLLPRGFSVDCLTNARRSPFSPQEFQRQARLSGSIERYYSTMAEQMAAGTFVRRQVLTVAPTETDSLVANFFKTTAGDIYSDTVSLVDAGVFGAVTQALGLNLGTSGALNAISGQLNEVLNDLNTLQSSLNSDAAESNFRSDLTTFTQNASGIQSLNGTIGNLTTSNVSPADVANQLLTTDISANVTMISDFLEGNGSAGGQNNILIDYNVKHSTDTLNVSNNQIFLGCPVRFNDLVEDLQKQRTYSTNQLALAANIYAEAAHVYVPVQSANTNQEPTSLAQKLNATAETFDDLAATVQQGRACVPELLNSDELTLDLERNLMWYNFWLPEDTYDNAKNVAAHFQEGGYNYFRLATRQEITDFISNRIQRKVSNADSDTDWRSAFTAFGFDLTNYGQNYYHNNSRPDNTNYQGQSYFILESDSGANNQNLYQWYGVKSAPATSYYYSEDTGGKTNDDTRGSKSAYILVRTYGQGPSYQQQGSIESQLSGFDGTPLNPPAYAQLGNTTLQMSQNGNILSAAAQFTANEETTPPYDVTNLAAWKSSNRRVATISTLPGIDQESGNVTNIPANPPGTYAGPGQPGNITWHPDLDGNPLPAVTFTATYWGGGPGGGLYPTSATGTITLNAPTGLTPNATSAQILPAKLGIDLTSVDNNVSTFFFVTTFYEDGQVDSPNSGITFELYSPSNQLINSSQAGGGFISSKANELVLNRSLPAGTYTIKATYNARNGANTKPMQATTTLSITNILSKR